MVVICDGTVCQNIETKGCPTGGPTLWIDWMLRKPLQIAVVGLTVSEVKFDYPIKRRRFLHRRRTYATDGDRSDDVVGDNSIQEWVRQEIWEVHLG